jgi:hypothetical protein
MQILRTCDNQENRQWNLADLSGCAEKNEADEASPEVYRSLDRTDDIPIVRGRTGD